MSQLPPNQDQFQYDFKTEQEREAYKKRIEEVLAPKPVTQEDKRLQQGYSKKQWAIVVRAHKEINDAVTVLMTELLADLLPSGVKFDTEEGQAMFKPYDKRFRDYIRKAWVKNYPVSKDADAKLVRQRLLSIFTRKAEQVFKKI